MPTDDLIRLQDIELDELCPRCQGDGWVIHPAWSEWWQHNENVPPDDHPVNEWDEEIPCSDCAGQGTRPTAAGAAILSLVRRYAAA